MDAIDWIIVFTAAGNALCLLIQGVLFVRSRRHR